MEGIILSLKPVDQKESSVGSCHAVILVVDMTDKQKCLTSEPACVRLCVSQHVSVVAVGV